MREIIKLGFLHALATALYIVGVVHLIFYVPQYVNLPEGESVLIPILMLMLFVFSAAVTGALVFARPIIWFIEGKKKDALKLLGSTLGIFFVLLALLALSIFFFQGERQNTFLYSCAEGKTIKARFYPEDDTRVDLYLSDGRNVTLPHVVSASGARYANTDESVVFWNKGNTAFITEGTAQTQTYSNCIEKGED